MHKVKLSLPDEIESWIDRNPSLPKMLQLSKTRGFIGKSTDIRDAIRHSIGYAVVIDYILGFANGTSRHGCNIIDVGSGGGLPGIPLAYYLAREHGGEHGGMEITLLDASLKKTNFLKYVLNIASNEEHILHNTLIVSERAELFGREPSRRNSFRFATARSLARPATTVELCSPLLQPGGHLIVSLEQQSVSSLQAWSDDGLDKFGMVKIDEVIVGGYGYIVIAQISPCPNDYPRRTGIPSKKPAW